MPRNKNYRKKRRYRKKRGRKKTGMVSLLGVSNQPFPPSLMVKHRYAESFTLDPSISTTAHVAYKANAMYDPTDALGGHQPLGFEQLTPIYNYYTVIGAKATITFFSGSDSPSTGPVMCYAYLNDDNSPVNTYDTVLEQGTGRVKPLTSNTSGGSCTIVQKFSAKKYFGVTDIKDNDDLRGHQTADPSQMAFFIIGAQGVSSAVDPTVIRCNVIIEYIAIWSERNALAQSNSA